MTETDTTKRPLEMPERFLPYLEKNRIYIFFKDMIRDLVVTLPKDHLKHLKVYLTYHLHSSQAPDRINLLVSPDLKIDVKLIAKEMIKDLGCFVITRRCVMDRYEKHDKYEAGCVSPVLMSEVTKSMTMKDPVPQAGWLMFDHPCTVREARCLQQDGVLPNVTLVLMPTPPTAPPAENHLTPPRDFFQQDFEGLKFAYKATLKEVHIDPAEDPDKISVKCFNAVQACLSGAQGPKQGHHVVGAPGVYRVLLIGPRGSGRRSQAQILAKHFGLDCIDNGWVLTGYPTCGRDFEILDNMPTPPNRVIILNTDMETCQARNTAEGVDWCTGKSAPMGSGPRVLSHPRCDPALLEAELDFYFTEALAELRAAAGITAVEINAQEPFDQVQVRIQAAVIAAPNFDIDTYSPLRNVRAD